LLVPTGSEPVTAERDTLALGFAFACANISSGPIRPLLWCYILIGAGPTGAAKVQSTTYTRDQSGQSLKTRGYIARTARIRNLLFSSGEHGPPLWQSGPG
jgi:hypothetical protein